MQVSDEWDFSFSFRCQGAQSDTALEQRGTEQRDRGAAGRLLSPFRTEGGQSWHPAIPPSTSLCVPARPALVSHHLQFADVACGVNGWKGGCVVTGLEQGTENQALLGSLTLESPSYRPAPMHLWVFAPVQQGGQHSAS